MNVKELKEMIIKKVEKEYIEQGRSGLETIAVKFNFTDEQKELAYGLDLDDRYNLTEDDNNIVYVTYYEGLQDNE